MIYFKNTTFLICFNLNNKKNIVVRITLNISLLLNINKSDKNF